MPRVKFGPEEGALRRVDGQALTPSVIVKQDEAQDFLMFIVAGNCRLVRRDKVGGEG